MKIGVFVQPQVNILFHVIYECIHIYIFLRVSLDESNLVITNVNRGDEGNYTCVIKNELEQKSVSAHLMVMGTTLNK